MLDHILNSLNYTQVSLVQRTLNAWLCLIALQKLWTLIQLYNKCNLGWGDAFDIASMRNFQFLSPNNNKSPFLEIFYFIYSIVHCLKSQVYMVEQNPHSFQNFGFQVVVFFFAILMRKYNLIILAGVSCELLHKIKDSLTLIRLKFYNGFLHVLFQFLQQAHNTGHFYVILGLRKMKL